MKEKIEEILEAYTNYGFGENLDNVIEMEFKMKTPTGKVGEYIGYPSLVNELTTLIQSERKKAVEGFAHWCESNKLGSCVLSDAEEYLSQLNKEEE